MKVYDKICTGFLLCLMIISYSTCLFAAETTLSWNPPVDNADGTPLTDLDGYKVYYGIQSGSYSESIDVGNVTTYKVSSLSNGISYYFAVTAYDTSGNESSFSNEVNKIAQSSDTSPPEAGIKIEKVLLSEDFSNGIPDTWTTHGAWNTQNTCGKTISYPFSKPFAIVDSSCMETDIDELITEPFSTASCNSVELSYSNQYFWYAGNMEVDVSSDRGATWTDNALTVTNDGYPVPNTKELDLSSTVESEESQVRFKYANDEISGHWAIDDVLITCQPTKVEFSSEISVPVQEKIAITNTGTTNLTINAINIEGADSSEFSIGENNNCLNKTLMQNEICTFDVVFTPGSDSLKNAILSILSNDSAMPEADILLTGITTEPAPDLYIKANGSTETINLSRNDNLSITMALDPGIHEGKNADWWIMFKYRERWYYYNSLNNKWRRGTSVYKQGPLSATDPVEIFNNTGLPAGVYTFYLMVDTNMNGHKDADQLHYSEVTVRIQ